MKRRLAALVCYDAVGFSSALAKNEAETLTALARHRHEVIDPIITRCGGRVVKRTGDGALLEFQSPVPALAFALEMQTGIDALADEDDGNEGLRYRIGLTIGDVFDDGEDLYGDGLNLATRLETLSEPGGIVISESFREQLHGKVQMNLRSLGDVSVKPGDRPVGAYQVVDAEIQGQTIGFEAVLMSPKQPAIWFGVLVGAVLLTLAGVIYWIWMYPSNKAVEPDAPRVAVLPLETPAQDEEIRWLGDGVSDDVVTYLSKFRELQVLSRESSFRYASGVPDYSAMRRDLGAEFVVAGRVELRDDNVFLTLRLVETQSGAQIWAQKYEGPYLELLDIREDMLQRVSAQLFSAARAELGDRVASHSPSDLQAYELVLRGWRAYFQFNKASTLEAEALVKRAITLDSEYAPAHALLARLLTQFYVQPYDDRRGDPRVIEMALEAAQLAVNLDPRSADALAWLGNVHVWKGEHEQALNDIEKAIALNPGNASIWFIYADGLSRAGQQQASLMAWTEARKLDAAASPLNDGLEARSHLLLGDAERAFDLTSKCLRRVPKLLPCNLFHIMAASEVGREDQVKASVNTIREIAPRFTVSGWRDIIKFGDQSEADRLSGLLISAGLSP